VQGLVDVAEVGPGQRVLIVGAAGGVGHFAVQMARHLGAQVTGVCGPANVEFVKRLGAEHVLDHRKSAAASWGRDFDLVYDVAGVLDWRRAARLLRRGGLYIGTSGTAGAAMFTGLGSMLAPIVSGTRARNVNLRADTAALVRLAELAARGVLKPHVAERIGLAEVPRAQAAMQRGHGRGKIVVLPQQGTA
jgi:NADPH:quinone reductase-like Zn-dependent oxidoreductase